MSADLAPSNEKTSNAVLVAPKTQSTVVDITYTNHALLAIAAIALFYHQTLWSMIVVWSRSQTFAHGFVILPISAWLIWRQRERLASIPLRPSMAALLLLAAFGLAWLLAAAANVPVVMQYAVVAMIPVAVMAILGWKMAYAIAFPLAYLLLAVPFGEVFLGPLMEFTASFTVAALQLTGIPVFRENNVFSIPSGNWSVVEACSGLRYVIASFTLGTLYAYLNYRSLRRRLIFIGLAMILPIFANGVRAYSIVMIGHWSDMQLAVGVDHLIYGWFFFGLVSLLLFWSGSFWREAPAPALASLTGAPVTQRRSNLGAATVAVIVISACWPLMETLMLESTLDERSVVLRIVAPQPPWVISNWSPGDWRVNHAGHPLNLEQAYHNSNFNRSVNLQVFWYQRQQKDIQLLTLVDAPDQGFRELESSTRSIPLVGATLSVHQTILQSNSTHLLVWRWYRQSGVDTANPFLVKFLLARNKVLHLRQDGADIIVAVRFDDKPSQAEAEMLLQQFLADMLPAIHQGLNHVASH